MGEGRNSGKYFLNDFVGVLIFYHGMIVTSFRRKPIHLPAPKTHFVQALVSYPVLFETRKLPLVFIKGVKLMRSRPKCWLSAEYFRLGQH